MSAEGEWVYSPWGYGRLIETHTDKAILELQADGKLF